MTKVHDLGTDCRTRHPHGRSNKVYSRRPASERHPERSIRKVDASTVAYGESVTRNGSTCWAAYHNGELVAVAGSAPEARRRYLFWIANRPHPDTA